MATRRSNKKPAVPDAKSRPKRKPSSPSDRDPQSARTRERDRKEPKPTPRRSSTRPATFRLKVRRQDGPERVETRRWEVFEIPLAPRMNVISALQYIQRHPVTIEGRHVAPVAWECSCLEEVCGACTMLINGRVRQACSALIDDLVTRRRPIVLEPLRKFPVVRDLAVDRSRMFDTLKQLRAWLDLDGTHDLGPGPVQSQEGQRQLYPLSRCMSCGSCLEACPQYGEHSEFVGASAINQVRLVTSHPIGRLQKAERVELLMAPGGVADCGKAQNCVEVCPAKIPLVDSIQHMARETTGRLIFGWLLK
jgi:succinate dehydrogenase / fumarate reductase iron-sulfur subunit